MRPRRTTLGGLECHVEGDLRGRVAVLLHGFGAPGGDLVPLASEMEVPAGTSFVFPEAPLQLPWGWDSRAWWMIDMARLERAMATGLPREIDAATPPGMPEARAAMLALVDELATAHGVDPSRLVLGGFSQGSMLAMDVALRMPSPPAGVVLWSTTFVTEPEWTALMAERSGMRAFLSHGTEDPLLPFSAAERLKDALLAAGWSVTWLPFRGGHQIPLAALEGAAAIVRGIDG